MVFCLLTITLSLMLMQHNAVISGFTYSTVQNRVSLAVPDERAKELWDRTILAKGGNEKLLDVRNMVISRKSTYVNSKGDKNPWIQEELLVFPEKHWFWNDMRPDVFGLRVEMYNYRDKVFYVASPDDSKDKIQPLPEYKKWEDSTLFNTQVIYFMQTKWIQPEPYAISQGEIDRQKVNIIQTRIGSKEVDFVIDLRSQLPIRVTFYESSAERGRSTLHSIDLSDYIQVDGIRIPQTLTLRDGKKYTSNVKINVEYKEGIFQNPPRFDAGAEAWRKS